MVIAIALLVGMFVGALLYSWWSRRSTEAVAPIAPEASHPEEKNGLLQLSKEAIRNGGVKIEPAELRSLRTTLTATGVVAPDQSRVAHIRPIARGLVEKVHVQLGAYVSAGDVIIEYDNIELGLAIGEYLSALAALDSSHTDLEVKRTILERSEEMLKVGATARTTHDIRQAEFRNAEAKVNSAQAIVAKIEEQIHRFGTSDADLAKLAGKQGAQAHRTESHSTLRAPFSGVITTYDVAEGELVEPSDELVTITDLSTVWVMADVYEKDLGQVRVGQMAAVRVVSYPSEIFHGRITYISDVIESATRTAKVRCVVRNRVPRLRLEMFATIEIPTSGAEQMLAVPSAAIQQMSDRPVVFVQRSETEFEKRDVDTGVVDRGWVEIKSGVDAGDRVVTSGSFYLKSALLRELIGGEE